MAKALRIIEQRLGALMDAWRVADVALRGVSPAVVSVKSPGESPLLPTPEKASTGLERPAPAVRTFGTESARQESPESPGWTP